MGEIFGTVAWLWVFHRFRQDGRVLLGMEHPWEHGGHDHHDESTVMGTIQQIQGEEAVAKWQSFSERAVIPGDDDDDDDDDDDEVGDSLCRRIFQIIFTMIMYQNTFIRRIESNNYNKIVLSIMHHVLHSNYHCLSTVQDDDDDDE